MDLKRLIKRQHSSAPTFQEELGRIKSLLRDCGSLALLFIDAARISRIEQAYGKKVYGEVLETLLNLIFGMRGREIREADIITVYGVEGEQFLIFLSRKREDREFYSTDLETLADRICDYLDHQLFKTVYPYLKSRPRIAVGHAIMIYNPLIQEERQIYKLVDDAKQMANYQQFRNTMRNKEKIQELIMKEAITTHFQPIVRLTDYQLLGYEALSRGPAGTEYEDPYITFETAAESDLAFELDRLCRRKAFLNARGVRLDQYLFINCLPAVIHDPEFKGEPLEVLLNELGLSASQIVMEISERDAIDNYEIFRKAAEYYKQLGFSIAVDDTGTGHSSLQTVVELRPQFVKLDLSLVQGLDRNPIKQELIRALVALSGSMGSNVIAEGIETKEELDRLIRLGVPYGQGFYIGRPAPSLVKPAL
jgi:EAL domain-containing protein (putative c-di-GMP-specific phosphodiesterase class I)